MFKISDWFTTEIVDHYGEQRQQTVFRVGKAIGASIVGLIVLIVVFGSFGTIGAGERGVKTRFGAVVGTMEQGLYFKLPIVEGVVAMDVQTQKEQVDVEAASSDLQDVHTVIALNYNVMPEKVSTLYVNVGEEYKSRIIDPAVQEAVKASTAKYTANDLIQNRPAVRDAIQKDLATKLAESFLQVSDVSIVDFKFSDVFNKAIEAKVTAEQNALAAKNKLDQVQFEAQQTVATAKAQAEAIQIQAQAINSQGGADYVMLQIAKQWDGHLPTTMVPGGALPFLNINTK